jgi:transposase
MGRRIKYQNREEIVARMRQPGAPSIGVLSEETGVPKATLYAWLRLSGGRSVTGAAEVIHMVKSKGRKRSPTQKLKLLAKSLELEGEALTRFCRDNDFLLSEAMAWRDQALSGLETADSPQGLVPREQVQDLEKELARKDKALAEISALLVLSKKVSRLFEEEK